MSYSYRYYVMLGLGAFGLMASSYKLLSLFFNKDKYQEKSLENSLQLSNLDIDKEKVNPIKYAFKALAKLRSQMEEYVIEKSPNIYKLRRSFTLNSDEEHEKICHQIILLKNEGFKIYIRKFNESSIYSYEEILNITKTIPYIEMEEQILNYMKIDVDISLGKNVIAESFLFFSSKYIELMKEEINFIQKNSLKIKRDYLNYRLSILKFKAEDYLFFKYGITELQLKSMIYKYKLHQEVEIQNRIYEIMKNEDYYILY